MGDCLSSFHEISVTIKVCVNVINILQKGGFRLTKFISNNRSLLQALPTQYLSKINGNQPFCKGYTNPTSLGNIMEPTDGYISYKIYTQISLNYQTRYPISNKFSFWSVRIYYTSFDGTEMDHTATLEKKNWLGRIVTFRSYKTLAKMARQFTKYTKYHFRQMVRINKH